VDAVYIAVIAVFGALCLALVEFCDVLSRGDRQ
jgi:hypothetical protein